MSSESQVVGRYRHPPVDPVTGKVSAADNAILMGQIRHCDVPPPHRKEGCAAIMHDHGWIDNGIENVDRTYGTTVCPAGPRWDGTRVGLDAICGWANSFDPLDDPVVAYNFTDDGWWGDPTVDTADGPLALEPGDYVVRVDGEFHVLRTT